jgi:pimeloyl-ACP methyl ester carboxylesterase
MLSTEAHAVSSRPVPRWAHTLKRKRVLSPDGTGIAYEVLGQGSRTLLLANGLGGRLYSLAPIVEEFWSDHRIITWDYRGLFESDNPASMRRLQVVDHVEDARAILDAEQIDCAVLFGWSMGVQISLDFAASYPERVAGLILVNGTHGHVFSTGFQPIVGIPGVARRLHALCEWLIARPGATDMLARLARLSELPTVALMFITAGMRSLELRATLKRYYEDVLGPSFHTYMRLFQELDAHSAYHLLPEITQPTLVVSGWLDFLTPAYQSYEIAKRMPNAEHLALVRASHFALLERTPEVIGAMRRFLDRRVTSWR